ncbi:hypothetical protein OF83DRAFT_1084751 [Amylostereum chailletii]|nr:hypothetical protein OF83DRAFT_1084751 [Amylostereum chailletii]
MADSETDERVATSTAQWASDRAYYEARLLNLVLTYNVPAGVYGIRTVPNTLGWIDVEDSVQLLGDVEREANIHIWFVGRVVHARFKEEDGSVAAIQSVTLSTIFEADRALARAQGVTEFSPLDGPVPSTKEIQADYIRDGNDSDGAAQQVTDEAPDLYRVHVLTCREGHNLQPNIRRIDRIIDCQRHGLHGFRGGIHWRRSGDGRLGREATNVSI